MQPKTCKVCGDTAKDQACLACIAFFRRSVQRHYKYRCGGIGQCDISLVTRSRCRSCRMNKCLQMGLRPENFHTRDPIGPRKFSSRSSSEEDQPLELSDFLLLHKRQNLRNHKNTCSELPMLSDVNHLLATSFRHAKEFSMQFESFRCLSVNNRNLVLSEYAIAFFLLDQAFKNTPDPLITPLSLQFHQLQIDSTECVFLKILLLLTPSFPGSIRLEDGEKNKFMSQLHTYSTSDQRFGEIILLIGLIRSAIKQFYNQTRQPGWLQLKNLEPAIRRRLLS